MEQHDPISTVICETTKVFLNEKVVDEEDNNAISVQIQSEKNPNDRPLFFKKIIRPRNADSQASKQMQSD